MVTKDRFQWILPSAVVVVICAAFITLSIRSFHDRGLEAEKPRRLDMVHTMRLALLDASQSQDSAVIAQDASVVEAAIQRGEASLTRFESAIQKLKQSVGDDFTTDRLPDIELRFAEFKTIYDQIAKLIAQNTNRKAYALATGRFLEVLNESDALLASLIDRSRSDGSLQLQREPAYEIRLSLLRIQTALIPHIFESSDTIMDKLELQIDAQEALIDKNLQALTAADVGDSDVTALTNKLTELQKLQLQIVGLSRENSNVRSEALSVRQRRDAFLSCESALVELEKQIHDQEPTSMIPKGREN